MISKINTHLNRSTEGTTWEQPTEFSIHELALVRSVVFAPDVNAKNRLHYFFTQAHLFSTDAIWYALRLAYEMGDVRRNHLPHLHKFLRQGTPIDAMMERKELALFSSLPQTLAVFKVLTPDQWERGDHDLSWYLSARTARCPPTPRTLPALKADRLLYVVTVSKHNVIALLNNRRQGEILLNTIQVKKAHQSVLTSKR